MRKTTIGYRITVDEADCWEDSLKQVDRDILVMTTNKSEKMTMSVPGCSAAALVKRYRVTRCVYLVIGRVAGIHRWEQK
jgi:hypothetical protein